MLLYYSRNVATDTIDRDEKEKCRDRICLFGDEEDALVANAVVKVISQVGISDKMLAKRTVN